MWCRGYGPLIGVLLFLVALGGGAYAYIDHYNTKIRPNLPKPPRKDRKPQKGMVRRTM